MESEMNSIVFLLTNVFDLYIIHKFMKIFFQNLNVNKKIAILCYLFKYLLSGVVMFKAPYPIVNLISTVAGIFLITLCYESEFIKKITTTIIIYMCTFAAEAVVALAAGLSDFAFFEKSECTSSFISIIIEMIIWIMALGLSRFKNVKINMPVPKTFSFAIVVISVSSIFLEMLIFEQQYVNTTIALVSLICILISNFIMVYLYDSLSKIFEEKTKVELVRREKEYYHNQTELLQKGDRELRQFRHDIKNRLYVMEDMIRNGETEKTCDYISKLTEKLDNTKMYSQTGNIAIDSIINYKLTKASEKGITVESNIVIPEDIGIEEDDMVIILGNLLDNAIEAADRLSDNKYIGINFEYEMNNVYITIKNSYDNIVNIVDGKMITRKGDSLMHGIGLKSVGEVIEKYNGIMNFKHNDNQFVVDIILYI